MQGISGGVSSVSQARSAVTVTTLELNAVSFLAGVLLSRHNSGAQVRTRTSNPSNVVRFEATASHVRAVACGGTLDNTEGPLPFHPGTTAKLLSSH